MQVRGMTLNDFRAFLKEQAAPHSSLQVIMMGKEPFDVITIMDEYKYGRLRRNHLASWGSDKNDWIETGHGYNDFMRICYICNVGLHSGTLPMVGGEGIYDEIKNDWIERPARGIIQACEILLKEGCFRPTRSLARLIGKPESVVLETCMSHARIYGDL